MRVARKEGAAMAKREGNKRQRQKRLEEAEKKAAEKAAEIARLHDPALRLVTFSGLTKLQLEGLKEQLRLRSFVDKRREDNGRALVLVPPTGEGGRSWLVLKLQSLLKMEFAENKFPDDPDDLEEGDLGLESRAPRAPRQSRARRWRRPMMATRRRHPSPRSAVVVSGSPSGRRKYQSPSPRLRVRGGCGWRAWRGP